MFRFSLRTCLLTCLVICLLLLGLAKLEGIRRDFVHAERISETSRLIEQLGGVVYETTAVIPVTIFKEGYHFRINLPESLRAIEIKGTINNSHDLQLLPRTIHRFKFCVSVDSVDQLPKLDAVRHVDIELVDGLDKTPISLDSQRNLRLKFSKQLVSLSLKGDQLTDDFVALFQDCKDIGVLRLNGGHLTGLGITTLNTEEILDLSLSGSLDDSHLANFPRFPELRSLHISSSNEINENGLTWLQGCDRLESVILCGGPYTAAVIANVTSLRKIATLELVDATVDDFSSFEKMKSLKSLRIINCPLSDEQLFQLSAITGLRELTIANTSVTSAGLSRLSSIRNLKHFETDIPLTSKEVAALELPPGLLSFSNWHLTANLDELRQMKRSHPNVSFWRQEYAAYSNSEYFRMRRGLAASSRKNHE
jgi:hypothetical protein